MPSTAPNTLVRRASALSLTAAVTVTSAVALGAGTASAAPCDTYVPGSVDRMSALLSSGTGSTGSSGSSGSSDLTGSLTSWGDGTPWDLPRVSAPTEALYMVTGPNSPDRTDEFGLASTDLGFMWDAGEGRTLMAFGDSFGCQESGDQWHSNSLFSSSDRDPSDGLYLDGPATGDRSGEFLPKSLKVPGVEHTKIPTSGVEVDGDQYVDFMSVKSWGNPGQWTTNYAQTVKSTDGGKTFSPIDESTRTSSKAASDSRLPTLPANTPGDDNFQMTAMTKHSDGGENGTDYVYVYGTPSGRDGSARLARIPEADFPDWSAARYWDGRDWVDDATAAEPVLDGRVAELSVQYNSHRDSWLAMHESTAGIVLREAPAPTGPWGPKHTVISRLQAPDIYGSFMVPELSGAQDPGAGADLYFVATTWSGYNTAMLRTDVDALLD